MPTPVRSARPGHVLALVSGAQFMIILDLAIVNVALPSIQVDLGASQADLQWVVSATASPSAASCCSAAASPTSSGDDPCCHRARRLRRRLVRRRALAARSACWSPARVVQGLGGALVSPAALSILTTTFAEGPARNRALGVFGAVGGTAATVGMIAGGAADHRAGLAVGVPDERADRRRAHRRAVLAVPSAPRPARTSFDAAGALRDRRTGGRRVRHQPQRRARLAAASTLGLLAAGGALLGHLRPRRVTLGGAARPAGDVPQPRDLTPRPSSRPWCSARSSPRSTRARCSCSRSSATRRSSPASPGWLPPVSSLIVAALLAARLVGRFGAACVLVVGQLAMAAGCCTCRRRPPTRPTGPTCSPASSRSASASASRAVGVQVAAFTGVEPAISGLAGGMLETAREIGGAIGVAAVPRSPSPAPSTCSPRAGGRPDVALTAGFERATFVRRRDQRRRRRSTAAVVLRRDEHADIETTRRGHRRWRAPPEEDPRTMFDTTTTTPAATDRRCDVSPRWSRYRRALTAHCYRMLGFGLRGRRRRAGDDGAGVAQHRPLRGPGAVRGLALPDRHQRLPQHALQRPRPPGPADGPRPAPSRGSPLPDPRPRRRGSARSPTPGCRHPAS